MERGPEDTSKHGEMGPLIGSSLYSSLALRVMLNFISLKNLDHWSEAPFVVSEARSTLRNLENVRRVLAGLSASLEETVNDIKQHILPFELGKGLAAIPDEVLSMIVEHAVREYYSKNAFTLKDTRADLSLVCRRFR